MAYLIFKLPYEILVKTIWSAQNQFSGQSKILLQKDPYNISEGNEDLIGFFQRFIDNCNLSLSKRFYQILGWRDETNTETFTIITLITITLIFIGFWKIIRNKNKEITFLSLFTTAQLTLSFIILQTRWDQPRITLVCMPIILILMFYAISSITIHQIVRFLNYLFVHFNFPFVFFYKRFSKFVNELKTSYFKFDNGTLPSQRLPSLDRFLGSVNVCRVKKNNYLCRNIL